MTKPGAAIFVCVTPRSGSTFLCEALRSTQLAGHPAEYYTPTIKDLMAQHNADTQLALYNRIIELGTSSNGVFSIKLSTGNGGFERLMKILNHLISPETPEREDNQANLVKHAFPNLLCIFLTRRNKVRQAVSWWKAVQTNQWGLQLGDKAASQKDLVYDFNAINTLVQEAVLREAGWQAFFDQMGIMPITVCYEDLSTHFEQTMRYILDAIGLKDSPVPPPVTTWRVQADDLSESWVQQFRKEKQDGWTNIGW